MSSGVFESPLAPCVKTRKSPDEPAARCNVPRTGATPGVLSMKEVVALLTCKPTIAEGGQLSATLPALPVQLFSLTCFHDFGRIDGIGIKLHFCHFPVFVDEVIHSPSSFVLGIEDAVLLGYVTAPIAEKRKRYADLLSPCLVREGRIHTYTQNLGIRSFQLGKVLLEVLHLLGSTTGERKHIKPERNVLLSLEVV